MNNLVCTQWTSAEKLLQDSLAINILALGMFFTIFIAALILLIALQIKLKEERLIERRKMQIKENESAKTLGQ